MTILFFARLFYPHIGGVEKHVSEVGKRLIKKGHNLIVITESSTEIYPKGEKPLLYEKKDGIEIYRIPVRQTGNKKWVIWRWMWQHRQLLQKADIIHAHDVFFWYLPFYVLFPQKPVYTTFHGYETYPIRWQAKWMRKVAEVLSKGNICIGDFMKKWYGTKPSYISYGGVKIFSHHSVPESKSALFWGRLDEHTGILTYEAAVDIIGKEFTQFRFTVIGEGNLSNKIDQKYLASGFTTDISKYLNNNRFAFVSRYLSILEALAAKRLVFAVYDNPVKKDYLEMSAFAPYIIIEDTPEKLAEKIQYFLMHPEKEQELVEKAYLWVQDQTWENVVSVYEKLWDII